MHGREDDHHRPGGIRPAQSPQDGDSFSQVIKKYLPAVGSTAGDLLVALDGSTVSDETVDRIAEAVEGRRHSPVREPSW